MAIEVVLPMLGITVEKGRILKWHKQEGDRVLKGEILFEVETEKVVTEVESPATGILGRDPGGGRRGSASSHGGGPDSGGGRRTPQGGSKGRPASFQVP